MANRIRTIYHPKFCIDPPLLQFDIKIPKFKKMYLKKVKDYFDENLVKITTKMRSVV